MAACLDPTPGPAPSVGGEPPLDAQEVSTSPGFDRLFSALERRLAPLDTLARPLWLGALTHTQGALEPRLHGLAALLQYLQADPKKEGSEKEGAVHDGAVHDGAVHDGAVQKALQHWPPPALASLLAPALQALDLPRFCQHQPSLADTIALSLLFHLDFIAHYQDRGASQASAMAMAVQSFAAEWQQRQGEMDALLQVFGALPKDLSPEQWGMLQGVLQSEGWQEVLHAHRLLHRLPALRRLIQSLGRSQSTDGVDPRTQATAPHLQDGSAHQPCTQQIQVPDLPGQTRGVHRSNRIARMLPSETLLLTRSTLRLLWHAKRAERALLCYEDDDHFSQLQQQRTPMPLPLQGPVATPRCVAGPMLVCVDTSGSMRGAAEAVAKAVVLEAMQVAQAQGRNCQVFAFGGDSEIAELELGLDLAGIRRVSDFLAQSFHGGTDICGPLECVLQRLTQERWQRADLLLVSDGEFGATPAVVQRLHRARQTLGLRVQGVLIGDRETLGLLEVCDHIFALPDWRRFGTGPADSPVHTPSLTALYFPGAIRKPLGVAD